MNERRRSFTVPGISLLLLIFLSLCLITFALLSLSGATADETLSQKAAERTTDYYQASNQANQILSEVDTFLSEILRQAESSSASALTYEELCKELPSRIPESTLEEHSFSFSVVVTDCQILQVELSLDYPENEDGSLYRITCWKIVNTDDWNPDTKQNVFIQTE